MADQKDLDEAFERGRIVGQREGFALQGFPSVAGWLPGVGFEFETSWFDSFVAYERLLTGFLRRIQQARWIERREGSEGLVGLPFLGPRMPEGDHAAMLAEHEERIKDELEKARHAADAELAEGRGRSCIVEAMRASPQRPASVVEFQDVASFVEADPRRGLPGSSSKDDAGGTDLGVHWQLENLFRRWEATFWRISWLGTNGGRRDPTDEIYAIEFLDGPTRDSGRVWLLGKLPTREAVDRALDDLFFHAMRERNSVAAAAAAVAEAMKEDPRG